VERKRYKRYSQNGSLEKELGTGTRLYIGNIQAWHMVQVADGARQAFWTLRRES